MNQDIYFGELDCPTFYVTLLPKSNSIRFTESGIGRDETIDYIQQHVTENDCRNYDIVLQEYFENLFGGNIIINPDGTLVAEFRKGKQGPIARGKVIPEFFVTRNQFTNSFRYSFESLI